MTRKQGMAALVGATLGLIVAVGIAVWQLPPSAVDVRRTVVTTLQQESAESFLVTGTLTLTTRVTVDSTGYATPDWLTQLLQATNPGLLSLVEGSTAATVSVPGRVSYGFDVRTLPADDVTVERGGLVSVALPPLALYSVEPDLSKLELKTASQGWMTLVSSEAHSAVRDAAMAQVQDALRAQAQDYLDTATQPRVNTARALASMLTPPLRAVGVDAPRFRIRVADDLVLTPTPVPTDSAGVDSFAVETSRLPTAPADSVTPR